MAYLYSRACWAPLAAADLPLLLGLLLLLLLLLPPPASAALVARGKAEVGERGMCEIESVGSGQVRGVSKAKGSPSLKMFLNSSGISVVSITTCARPGGMAPAMTSAVSSSAMKNTCELTVLSELSARARRMGETP